MSSVESNFKRVDARAVFATTRWSLILAAGESACEKSDEALSQLYRTYQYPLYAFLRRSGKSPQDAEDLTQSFFEHLLAKKVLRRVDPNRGKFRSFLLASLKNLLANEWDRSHAAKRGGKHTIVSLDETAAEDRYQQEPSHNSTPDKLYEQSWRLTVIDSALQKLRDKYRARGKSEMFEALQDRLIDAADSDSYTELAAKLNMGEGAVRMAVRRMRERFHYLLRAEIAHTVESPSEIDEEIRYLISNAG